MSLHGPFRGWQAVNPNSLWEAEMIDSMFTDARGRRRIVNSDSPTVRGIVRTCSIWTIRESRIAEIAEVASFEGTRLDLGDH
jgi:hypothetical protein